MQLQVERRPQGSRYPSARFTSPRYRRDEWCRARGRAINSTGYGPTACVAECVRPSDRSFAETTTEHPAQIPREASASPRPRPVIAATPRSEGPGHAANPRSVPTNPGRARPARHAGGRGFESRRSPRKSPCKSASCVVRLDGGSPPTTQTFSRRQRKRAKTARNPSSGSRFQAISGRGRTGHEGRLQLHETAGGQG